MMQLSLVYVLGEAQAGSRRGIWMTRGAMGKAFSAEVRVIQLRLFEGIQGEGMAWHGTDGFNLYGVFRVWSVGYYIAVCLFVLMKYIGYRVNGERHG